MQAVTDTRDKARNLWRAGVAYAQGDGRGLSVSLLVHGTADMSVSLQAMRDAEDALRAAGVAVETLVRPGIGHTIDEEGLVRGGIFLHQQLNGTRT